MDDVTNLLAIQSINNSKFSKSSDFVCTVYAMGKSILRTYYLKIRAEPLQFLECIQGKKFWSIHPLARPYWYFMVPIDASTILSRMCLLSTRNHASAWFIAQIIKLRAHYPEHLIKSIGMDNGGKPQKPSINIVSI